MMRFLMLDQFLLVALLLSAQTAMGTDSFFFQDVSESEAQAICREVHGTYFSEKQDVLGLYDKLNFSEGAYLQYQGGGVVSFSPQESDIHFLVQKNGQNYFSHILVSSDGMEESLTEHRAHYDDEYGWYFKLKESPEITKAFGGGLLFRSGQNLGVRYGIFNNIRVDEADCSKVTINLGHIYIDFEIGKEQCDENHQCKKLEYKKVGSGSDGFLGYLLTLSGGAQAFYALSKEGNLLITTITDGVPDSEEEYTRY